MKRKDSIFELIKKEEKRQKETLMMIPSENYTYPEVRKAVGSFLMHKYAEGQPHKRYYQGVEYVDDIEEICEKLALSVFGLKETEWGVNVQPYSGTPANLAVYNALLETGDKILSMYLPDGGHLSHGWEYQGRKITLVSKIYQVNFYRVNPETCVFDYDQIEEKAILFQPKLIISGGTSYPRQINHKRMGEIAKKVKAYYMADIAHEAGLVAGGANKSPFPHADVVTMTTHKTLRGPRGAMIFARKELMDRIDASVFPGVQGGPHLHTIAGIAICLQKAKEKKFKSYAKNVVANARLLGELLIKKGLKVVSGGTDKHLVLLDLREKGTGGWFVAWALEKAGIIVNKNTVPYDPAPPFYPSGIRLGTPAITARGMGAKEIKLIADWISQVVEMVSGFNLPKNEAARKTYLEAFKKKFEKDLRLLMIRKEVKKLCLNFPIE